MKSFFPRRCRSGQVARRYLVVHFAMYAATNLMYCSASAAVVLTFDDLPADIKITDTSYGGLSWENGNPGLSGFAGYWTTVGPSNNHPYSAPRNLVNAAGSTVIGVGFPSAVDMHGAYVASQGNMAGASTIRADGYLGGVLVDSTPWFLNVTTTPQWFDLSSLTNVDRVVFLSTPVFDNASAYGLDDLTFTYIPEAASLAMFGLAGAGLLARRRRKCSH